MSRCSACATSALHRRLADLAARPWAWSVTAQLPRPQGEDMAAMKVLIRYTRDEFADKECEQHDMSSWRIMCAALQGCMLVPAVHT